MSLEKCKESLPNFPDEVIDSWLSTYVETEGWPPCSDDSQVPQNRWKFLLGKRPVQYWQNLSWELVDLSFVTLSLERASYIRIGQLLDTYVNGLTNIYTYEMGDNGPQRFWGIMRYIAEHGKMPVAPVFVVQDGGFEVMDGNHRVSAGMAWFKLQNNKKFADQLSFQTKPYFGNFNAWVGRKNA